MAFVLGDTSVLTVLERRRDEGSEPGHRTDPHRVALVVEGGGMRGAYSGGMLRALERLGLRAGFDVIYGTSAGAFNAVAFALGHGEGAARIYAEDLSGTRFIDPLRPLSRQPVILLDYLVEQVLTVSKPLDLDALADSGVPVIPVATAAATMRAHGLEPLRGKAEWQAALRATASIPLLAGPPIPFGDGLWIDGSISEPMAVRRALAAGATHVLALLSRAAGEPPSPGGDRTGLVSALLERKTAGLGRVVAARPRVHAWQLSAFTGPGVLGLRPIGTARVGNLTTSAARLAHAADIGTATVHAAYRALTRPRP